MLCSQILEIFSPSSHKSGFLGKDAPRAEPLYATQKYPYFRNVRQSIAAIKSHAHEISPEMEIDLELFESARYFSGEKGVLYWYVRN